MRTYKKVREVRMRKNMEQIVLEQQAAKCQTVEELFLLWQLMQQSEEEPFGKTCYEEIDQRSFHIDGIISANDYDGTLFILKETNMKKFIQRDQNMPVISDIRRQAAAGKSPTGEVEYLDHLAGMQFILGQTPAKEETGGIVPLHREKLRKAAILYINKRGGKGASDDISMCYGQYYIEFIRRQIHLLKPKTIVCCGEDIFRLIVMEVFQNKRQKKNREIYMKWKNVVIGDIFYTDSRFYPEVPDKSAPVRVIRMWNPAYRVNNGQYVSLEEYLGEFKRRIGITGKEE